jgi:hypothetical protein
MSSSEEEVSAIHQDREVPDMTVFELALISAITRNPPHQGDDTIVSSLSDWFLQPVRLPDARRAADRMVSKGWLNQGRSDAVSECLPTPDGVDSATTLYGGCIRMLDRGMGLLNVRLLSNLFDGLGEKS